MNRNCPAWSPQSFKLLNLKTSHENFSPYVKLLLIFFIPSPSFNLAMKGKCIFSSSLLYIASIYHNDCTTESEIGVSGLSFSLSCRFLSWPWLSESLLQWAVINVSLCFIRSMLMIDLLMLVKRWQNHECKNAGKIWCASWTLNLQCVTMATTHVKNEKN